jgi:lysine 2,3-aminomutase
MDRRDSNCPVRLQAVPSQAEFVHNQTSSIDPVGDREYRRTRRVIHKYPDRAAFLVTDVCPVYCRHCTRKYHTMDLQGTYFGDGAETSYETDFAYLRAHHEIRDVLLTGGDPLSLPDGRIEKILTALRSISHIEVIRLGSRYPVLLPQRITPELCRTLAAYHPVFLMTHFNHAKEVTPDASRACASLLQHGIPVLNQSVLLKGVNDNVQAMRSLLTALVKIRVVPYYLYHCDDVTGVSHFMTSIHTGRSIMRGLTGFISGFAVPRYVITTKLGKISLAEDETTVLDDGLALRGYTDETVLLTDKRLLSGE